MSYIYQWFGVVTGAAFLHGCMVGLFSPASWAPVPLRAERDRVLKH